MQITPRDKKLQQVASVLLRTTRVVVPGAVLPGIVALVAVALSAAAVFKVCAIVSISAFLYGIAAQAFVEWVRVKLR